MKEQTAVEWLLKAQFELIFDKGMSKRQYLAKRVRIEKQAKQMEKEQIINAFDEGQEYEYHYHINSAPKFDSETYYNETFNE